MYSGRLYTSLGPIGQEWLIAAHEHVRKALREGHLYRKLLSEICTTQWLSADELAYFQQQKLAEMLTWVRERVPYFAGRFERHECSDPFTLLRTLPYIDKPVVRSEGPSMQARVFGPFVTGKTGGSTGSPLTLRHDFLSVVREQAFIARQLQWAGNRPGDRQAWWRGDLVVPVAQSEPPFWRRNRAKNMLMLSSYHLSEKNAQAYRIALERFDPVIIQAYPSSIGFLAKVLESKRQQYRGSSLRGVLTSSETLTHEQRRAIEATMGCRVFDWYGGYERVAAVGTCEHGNYHLISDYGYVELRPVEGGHHEIVGTSFYERAMPLVRYCTGDEVELPRTDTICRCGRAFPVVDRVTGRMEDYVKTPDGRFIGSLDIFVKDVDYLAEAQVRQLKLNEIEIAVVPLKGFNEAIERKILANARERLGTEIRIRIVTVPSVPRTSNGKVRGVVCEV